MDKYKKLAFNTLIFAIGTFGSKILVLLLTRLYTANISPDEMGIKSYLTTTALLLQPVFTLALQEYMIRFALDKKYDKTKVFTTSCVITGIGMLAMLLILPGLRFIPVFDFLKGYSMLMVLYIGASSLRMLFAQFVRARDMVKLFALDGILATLLLLIFNLIFIAGMKMGVKGFVISVILSDLSSSAFLFLVGGLRKFFNIKKLSAPVAVEMMRFAIPLIPTIVMWSITSLSDRLFIKEMHSTTVELGSGAAGLYEIANTVPNLISMVSTIFFQAWNMSAIMENDSADRSKFYEKVYGVYESVLFVAAAGLLFLIKPVTAILVNSDNFDAYSKVYIYTPILAASVIFMALNQFLGGIYSATKHSKNSFWTALAACCVNLVMNFFLIPVWGIQGAAVATFLSYYVCYWLRMVDARYYVPFKFDIVRAGVNTAVLFAMCAVILISPQCMALWLFIFFAFIVFFNYKALMDTVMKVLKR